MTGCLTDVLRWAGDQATDPAAVPLLNAGLWYAPRDRLESLAYPPGRLPDHFTAEQDWWRWHVWKGGPWHGLTAAECGLWSTDDRDAFAGTDTIQHFAGWPWPGRAWATRAAPLRWAERPPAPGQRAAVVVGHFAMPGLAAAHAALIRRHAGPDTPIVVSDDHSYDGYDPARGEGPADGERRMHALLEVCDRERLAFRWAGPARRGWTGGDLAAFRNGVAYCRDHGIDCLVKLSQRFLIDRPGWLADLVALLDRHPGASIAGRRCRYGLNTVWALRTEAVALRVKDWCHGTAWDMLNHLPAGRSVEEHVARAAGCTPGGAVLRTWPLVPADRTAHPPDVFWKEAVGHDAAAYRRLGERYGVDVGDGFHTRPTYDHGRYVA